MNNESIKDNWEQLKGKIKEKWDRFSDDDIELMKGEGKGDEKNLADSLSEQYGIEKESAIQQAKEFLKSFEESLTKNDTLGEEIRTLSESFNTMKEQFVEKVEGIKEEIGEAPEAILQYVKAKPLTSMLGVFVFSAVCGFLMGRR